MVKELQILYKCLSILYPNDVDNRFDERIKKFLEYYLLDYDYKLKSSSNRELYVFSPNEYHWTRHHQAEKIEDTESFNDLFTLSKRFHLFRKNEQILQLKKDMRYTVNELAKNDIFMQSMIKEISEKLKEEVRFYAQNKAAKMVEQKAKENHSKRGNFYKNPEYTEKPKLINVNAICLVHATDFYPQKNKDGRYVIETTAHATDWLNPRPTVHFTCNHIVESHLYGDWDTKPYIIMAPLTDVIELNGKPRRFSGIDTYFLPDQETGVVLPDSVMIVEPSDKLPKDKLLFITKNNHAYYRRKNFSDEMKKTLLENYNVTKNISDSELSVVAREYATRQLMAFNGFLYIGSTLNDNKKLGSFYLTGLENDFAAHPTQYVHVSDPETRLNASGIFSILNDILKGKNIDLKDYEINFLKDWINNVILNNEPIQEFDVNEKDLGPIRVTKENFNSATKKLIQKLHEIIKKPEDILRFLSKEKE